MKKSSSIVKNTTVNNSLADAKIMGCDEILGRKRL